MANARNGLTGSCLPSINHEIEDLQIQKKFN